MPCASRNGHARINLTSHHLHIVKLNINLIHTHHYVPIHIIYCNESICYSGTVPVQKRRCICKNLSAAEFTRQELNVANSLCVYKWPLFIWWRLMGQIHCRRKMLTREEQQALQKVQRVRKCRGRPGLRAHSTHWPKAGVEQSGSWSPCKSAVQPKQAAEQTAFDMFLSRGCSES